MRQTITLTLARYPEIYTFRHHMVYDRVLFKDPAGNYLDYISQSCTINGKSTHLRTALMKWAWAHKIGDSITITANIQDNSIIEPRIIKEKSNESIH